MLLCGQSAHLFEGSIQDNFTEYGTYRDVPPISPEQAAAYLKICAAEFPLTMACATMSGGERQRVFAAVCLSLQPKVLLLDEPTSALDDGTANAMMANIKSFCRENAVSLIAVSHSKPLAEAFADYTVALGGGDGRE